MALTPLDEALDLVLADASCRAPAEHCPLSDGLGRVLAEDICAAVDVPPWDNSAMDGYALRAAESGKRLQVTQRIPAGTAGQPVEAGTAARIFTGAPVPPAADAVVMQENCRAEGDALELTQAVTAGENIRRRGEDIAQGDVVFSAGRRLQSEDLGVLASVGAVRQHGRR